MWRNNHLQTTCPDLTAAHCVTQLKNPNQILREFVAIDPKKGGAVFVVFGLLNWCPAKNKLDENWEGPWENIIPAEQITFHPSWNFDKSGEDFDIAIIKVSKCLIALEGYTCHAPPPSPKQTRLSLNKGYESNLTQNLPRPLT